MHSPRILLLVMAIMPGAIALAQMPTYNLGRAPRDEEIRGLDLVAGPAGKELPPGKGTAKEGTVIFAKKCAACHGREGEGTKIAPRLSKQEQSGLHQLHPFATTIWSIINTSMPRSLAEVGIRGDPLTADEVYALTAYILYMNDVIREDEVLDAKSLPAVRMPTRDPRLDSWVPPPNGTKH